MARIPFLYFLAVAFLATVRGGILNSVADVADEYDFIVVGGGTAGSVVANRLSEDSLVQVLVIEAGGSNEHIDEIKMPLLLTPAFDPTYSWNFTTVPQPGLGGRSPPFARGFVLGGSSSINGMIYTRGSAEDYDAIVQLTGDEGWSWDNLQPYIRKASNERWVEPVDNHSTSGQFDPMVHGFDGVTSVSLPPLAEAIDRRVTQTTEENPEFPFNLDTNSGNQLGIGWLQSTITSEGRRDSSATSYLGPDFISRPNIHILLNSQVTRLLLANQDSDGITAFDGVEFVERDNVGPKHIVTAKKEIILAAGSIGTPHLLLHSGIGDRDELSNLGITPTHHLPGVGKNLTEQPALNNVWLTNSTVTGNNTNNDPDTSGLPIGFFTHIGFLRIPDNASIFETVHDPAPGPNTAHIEFVLFNSLVVDPTSNVGSLSITTNVLTPISRGSITLNSSNPLEDPLINLGLLEHEFELFTMREAIRAAQRFLDSPAWDDYIIGPSEDLASVDLNNDSQLDTYIRQNVAPALHPVSTAAMSPYNISWGVTNPDLKVKGVKGVRVVDASVLPLIPSGHTQAPVYIVAERASDLIKLAWNITV